MLKWLQEGLNQTLACRAELTLWGWNRSFQFSVCNTLKFKDKPILRIGQKSALQHSLFWRYAKFSKWMRTIHMSVTTPSPITLFLPIFLFFPVIPFLTTSLIFSLVFLCHTISVIYQIFNLRKKIEVPNLQKKTHILSI